MFFISISLMTTIVEPPFCVLFIHSILYVLSPVNYLFISLSFAHLTISVYYLLKKIKTLSMELYSNPLKKYTLYMKNYVHLNMLY